MAVKRFEVLGALAGGVRKLLAEDVDVDVDVDGGEDDGKGLRDVLAALEERIRNGVLGRGVGVGVSSADGFGEEVTHSVATLSR